MIATYWVCVSARWSVPPQPCTEHGEGDADARKHTEKHPMHPTVTTTRRELADRLAAQMREAS